MSDVKRFDCTSGGSQYCYGCYTMSRDDEYGDYVLFEDYDRLRAELSRYRAWHDAVMAQKVVDAVDIGTAAMLMRQQNGRIIELQDGVDEIERRAVKAIIRPQPLEVKP